MNIEGYPRMRVLDGQLVRAERPGDGWKALDDAAANEHLRRLDGEGQPRLGSARPATVEQIRKGLLHNV